MTAQNVLREFRTDWLPHVSESGLNRLIELLSSASPLLIHGTFSRCVPMGCLATHIGWHHPATEHLQTEAGITWLTRVAGLNPALSQVILAWDRHGLHDLDLRDALLNECHAECERRNEYRDCETVDMVLVG